MQKNKRERERENRNKVFGAMGTKFSVKRIRNWLYIFKFAEIYEKKACRICGNNNNAKLSIAMQEAKCTRQRNVKIV